MAKELGWHFLATDCRLQYKPRRLVKPGMTLRRDRDKLELCEYGLHWSRRPLDALRYAPGCIVTRVECSGRTIYGDDQCDSSVRKVLWMADATETLREFARWCVLQVIYLWEVPKVVRQYLETGDMQWRAAASAATWAASWAASSAASMADARDAQNSKLEAMLMELELEV